METAILLSGIISVSVLGTVSEKNNPQPKTVIRLEKPHQSEEQKEFWKTLTKKSFNARKLQKFLNCGVDVNSRNTNGDTPFLYAVRTHKNRLLEFLLKIPEVNVNAVDFGGNTSVIIAAKYKNIDLIKRLINNIQYGQSDILNFLCAGKNHRKLSNEQIQKYIDERVRIFINTPNNYGNTALMTAVSCGNYILIRYLVEHGANVNQPNIFGFTPLISAIEKANKKLVKCLVEYNADDVFSNNEGEILLMLAKEKGLKKITKILEKVKAASSVN